MAYTPFTAADRFGGLNLRDDPDGAPGFAVDLLNVEVDQYNLRTRPGYTQFDSDVTTGSTAIKLMLDFPLAGQIVTYYEDASTQKLLPYSGVGSGTSTTPAVSVASLALWQAPTASYVYALTTLSVLHRWDGTTWTSPAATPQGTLLAAWGSQARMVAAKSATNPARVAFSDLGTAETWTANNFEDMAAGAVQYVVAWREFIFVFTGRTQLAVFYGVSTDSDGNPVFNYRTVDLGVKFVYGVCAGRDGVYFVSDEGVYVTAGGPPVKVSGVLDRWFSKDPLLAFTPTWSADATNSRDVKMTYANERVLISFPAGGTTRFMLVYDIKADTWTYWDLQPSALVGSRIASSVGNEEVFFGVTASAAVKINRMARADATDNGSAIAWRYTSTAHDLGEPGRVKITQESRCWGTGSVALAVSNDYGAFDAGSTLTLGTSPSVADAWQQIDREGTLWQFKLSGSGQASVNRLLHYVSFVKPAGVG